jgi:Protein of unknown function (DUF5656)
MNSRRVAPLDWLGVLSIRPRPPRTGVAYLVVHFTVYIAALGLIFLIYQTKERGLLIAPPIGLLCAAATWYLLGDTPVDSSRRLLLAAGIGLVLAQFAWAFGYWSTVPLVGSAALWLGLYVLSGVVEAGASDTLDRRIAFEYALVAGVGIAVVVAASRPWST